jgi:hypothetical protein
MSFEGPNFVIAIIFISTMGWVMTSWIRARHGYPLTDDNGRTVGKEGELAAERKVELLSTENAGLKGQIGRLEERIAVLERIATDPAERTAREIENLR